MLTLSLAYNEGIFLCYATSLKGGSTILQPLRWVGQQRATSRDLVVTLILKLSTMKGRAWWTLFRLSMAHSFSVFGVLCTLAYIYCIVSLTR